MMSGSKGHACQIVRAQSANNPQASGGKIPLEPGTIISAGEPSMENQYFNESLQNFVRDFAYGGAIRHLVDLGYDTDRIIKEYHYPLSRDTIDKMVRDHLESKKEGRTFP